MVLARAITEAKRGDPRSEVSRIQVNESKNENENEQWPENEQ